MFLSSLVDMPRYEYMLPSSAPVFLLVGVHTKSQSKRQGHLVRMFSVCSLTRKTTERRVRWSVDRSHTGERMCVCTRVFPSSVHLLCSLRWLRVQYDSTPYNGGNPKDNEKTTNNYHRDQKSCSFGTFLVPSGGVLARHFCQSSGVIILE